MPVTATIHLLAGPSHSTLSDGTDIGVPYSPIAENIGADGDYSWSLPENLPADNYRISITAGGITQESDGFNVYEDTAVNTISSFDTNRADISFHIHNNVIRMPMGIAHRPTWYGYIDRKFLLYKDTSGDYQEHTFKDYYFDKESDPRLPMGWRYGKVEDETALAADSPGIAPNTAYRYKMVPAFDGNQEAGLQAGGIDFTPTETTNNSTVKLSFYYDKDGWNPRTTHLMLYRCENPVGDDKLNTYYKVATIKMSSTGADPETTKRSLTNRCFAQLTTGGASIVNTSYWEGTDSTRKGGVGVFFYKVGDFGNVDEGIGKWYGDGWSAVYPPAVGDGDDHILYRGPIDFAPQGFTMGGDQGIDGDHESYRGVNDIEGHSASASGFSWGEHHYVDFGKSFNHLFCPNWITSVFGQADMLGRERLRVNFKAVNETFHNYHFNDDIHNNPNQFGAWMNPHDHHRPAPDEPNTNQLFHRTVSPEYYEKYLRCFSVVDIPNQEASYGSSSGEEYSFYVLNTETPDFSSAEYVPLIIDNYNLLKNGNFIHPDINTIEGDSTQTTQGSLGNWQTSNSFDDSFWWFMQNCAYVVRNPYHNASFTNTKLYQDFTLASDGAGDYIICVNILQTYEDVGSDKQVRILVRNETDDHNVFQEQTSFNGSYTSCFVGRVTFAAGDQNDTIRFSVGFDHTNWDTNDPVRYGIRSCGIFKILDGDVALTGQAAQQAGGKNWFTFDHSAEDSNYSSEAVGAYNGRQFNLFGNEYTGTQSYKNLIKAGTNDELPNTVSDDNNFTPIHQEITLRSETDIQEQANGEIMFQYIDTGQIKGASHSIGEVSTKVNYKYAKWIDGRNYVANVRILPGTQDEETHKNWVMYSELGKPDVVPITNFIQLEDLQGGEIVGLESLFSDLCIFMTKGIFRLSINSVDPSGWSLAESERNIGCLAPKSILPYENLVFFAGPDAFYMLDTNFNATPLTHAIHSQYVDNITSSATVAVDVERKELHLVLPKKSSYSYILDLQALESGSVRWREHRYSQSEETETFVTDENLKLQIIRHKKFTNSTLYSQTIESGKEPVFDSHNETITSSNIAITGNNGAGRAEILITGANITGNMAGSKIIAISGATDEDNNVGAEIVSIADVGSDMKITLGRTLTDASAGTSTTIDFLGPWDVTFNSGSIPWGTDDPIEWTPTESTLSGSNHDYNYYEVEEINNSLTKLTLKHRLVGDVPQYPFNADSSAASIGLDLEWKFKDGDSDEIDSNDTFLYTLNPSVNTEPTAMRKKTGQIKLTDDVTKGKTIRRVYIHYESKVDWSLILTTRKAISTDPISEYEEIVGQSTVIDIPTSLGFLKSMVVRPLVSNCRTVSVDIMCPETLGDFKIRKLILEVDD